ncbi:helix-turn-helix transcriptional regulator [uncultured Friedmanniella sp.]|uniref:helix-turn-helix transcriptional regulator n=1 Tax=uncultured Friedmanniella sp. TaxID=335381 RepID=UPI0035CB4A8F
MDNPSARLLRLLTLLQTRSCWPGAELCDRLGVSARTLRYDIAKLRGLGYLVHADAGVGGGYALQPGGTLPPLQLDDDEAIAIAIGLRSAAGVPGLGDPAAAALLKLEHVMPWRLRGRVNAVRTFTASVGESEPRTDPDMVAFLTGACRDRRRVRFDYPASSSSDGATSRREVEPYRLVQMDRSWYLQAFDPSRDDWRTFRLDRMRAKRPEGARFTAREAPPPTTLRTSADAYYARHRATVLVAAPAGTVAQRLPAQVPVERVDDHRCRVHATGPSPEALALNLVMIDQPFAVEDATPSVFAALRTLGNRIAAAGIR